MDFEMSAPSVGHETIDRLRGLQMVADSIVDPELKIDRIRQAVKLVPDQSIFDRQFLISSLQTFSHYPDDPPEVRQLFTRELTFVGTLASLGYMLDYDIPVDSLVLNIRDPEVIDIGPEAGAAFRKLALQVPILALDSCVLADVA